MFLAEKRIEEIEAEERIRRYFSAGLRPKGKLRHGQATPKIVAFHADRRRRRVLKGGNKSAKTYAGALDTLLICAGKHQWRPWRGPEAARCVAPDLPMGLDVPHTQRDTIREWCPPHWLRGGSFAEAYSVTGHVLHFGNGSFVEFMSYEQEVQKHAQERRTFIWFDEEPPKPIFDESMARLARGMMRGEWIMTYVPLAGLAWIKQELYEPALRGDRSDIGIHEVSIFDNAHNLPEGFIEDLQLGYGEEEAKVRLYGQYGMREGLVFDVFGADHVVEDEFEVVREP